MTPDLDRLPKLIDRIGQALLAASDAPTERAAGTAWNAYYQQFDAILEQLVLTEAAYWGRAGDATRLRLAGVASSCTGGSAGLLRNWIVAARRKLTEAGRS